MVVDNVILPVHVLPNIPEDILNVYRAGDFDFYNTFLMAWVEMATDVDVYESLRDLLSNTDWVTHSYTHDDYAAKFESYVQRTFAIYQHTKPIWQTYFWFLRDIPSFSVLYSVDIEYICDEDVLFKFQYVERPEQPPRLRENIPLKLEAQPCGGEVEILF